MPVKHLPDHWVGKRLVQISDIHVGNRFDWNYLIRAFKRTQSFQPDLVVYTGDFVSYESPEQFEQLKKVLAHAVKGRFGTLAVLGNHDYGFGWSQPEVAEQIVTILHHAGIQVLRNERTHQMGLYVVGIDDFWGTNFNGAHALNQADPSEATLVLCHNPDVADEPIWDDYQGWILSGHTHGGQCKPPFLPPPMLPVKNKTYTSGKFDLPGDRSLYINRALGCSFPVRFNVRPEITLFELQKG